MEINYRKPGYIFSLLMAISAFFWPYVSLSYIALMIITFVFVLVVVMRHSFRVSENELKAYKFKQLGLEELCKLSCIYSEVLIDRRNKISRKYEFFIDMFF